MKQCVIIAGLPRSGTSLLGGILDALGFWMGDDFLEAGPHNAKGTFNCVKLEAWCDKSFTDFPVTEAEHIINDEGVRKLRGLIHERLSKGVSFGLKCTRIWCAAPLLAELLTIPTKVVFTQRGTDRSLASWINAFDADTELSREFYRRAELSLRYFQQRNPWQSISVAFDSLIDSPKSEVDRIAAFLGVPSTEAAQNFPDKTLRKF